MIEHKQVSPEQYTSLYNFFVSVLNSQIAFKTIILGALGSVFKCIFGLADNKK